MRSMLGLLVLTGCIVEGSDDLPVLKGEGAVVIDPATGKVTLDTAQVPVLPACTAGQLVRRSDDGAGWGCASAEVPWDQVTGRPAEFPPGTHSHATLEAEIEAIKSAGPHAHPALEEQVAWLQADGASVVVEVETLKAHSHAASDLAVVPSSQSCPTRQFVRGFNANGTIQCGSAAPTCVVRSVNFTGAEATASCSGGEVRTGGGFFLSDGNNNALNWNDAASRPAGSNDWYCYRNVYGANTSTCYVVCCTF